MIALYSMNRVLLSKICFSLYSIPTPLEMDVVIARMCSFQVRCSSIVTPRNLVFFFFVERQFVYYNFERYYILNISIFKVYIGRFL